MTHIPQDEISAFLSARAQPSARIEWDDVYYLDTSSYDEHPEVLFDVLAHLKELENSPEGQQAFRELLASGNREHPVTIAYSEYFPANYDLDNDTIYMSNSLDLSGNIPESHTESFPLFLRLLHETDHAILKQKDRDNLLFIRSCLPEAYAKASACYEETAMARVNEARDRLGLPRREYYRYPESFAEWAAHHAQWNNLNAQTHIRQKARDAAISNFGCSLYDEADLQVQTDALLALAQAQIEAHDIQDIDVTASPPPTPNVEKWETGMPAVCTRAD